MENAGLGPTCSPRFRPHGPLLRTLVRKLGARRVRPCRSRCRVSTSLDRYAKRRKPPRRILVGESDGQSPRPRRREAHALGIERDQLVRGGEASEGAAPSHGPRTASLGPPWVFLPGGARDAGVHFGLPGNPCAHASLLEDEGRSTDGRGGAQRTGALPPRPRGRSGEPGLVGGRL